MPNFGDAPQQYDGSSLIPNGTIIRGIINIRPHNADQGIIAKQSKKTPDNWYLDVEITATEGKFARRKVFDNIGVAGSEKFVNNGRAAIKAILEFNGAGPNHMAGYNVPQTGDHPVHGVDWMALDGKEIAAKVKIEKGKDDYPDKNKIAVFLTPLDPSLKKDWERFISGDWDAVETARPAQQAATQPAWSAQGTQPVAGTPAQSAPAWGGTFAQGQAQGAAPQPAQQPLGRPSWMGAAPQQTAADDEIPF